MAVFAVIAQQGGDRIDAAVKRVFEAASYKMGPGQFVVASSQFTPQGVTTALGAEDGALGPVVVMEVTRFWGFHDDDLWTWFVTTGAI